MWQSIKRRIFAGLIAIVPIAVTFWILKFLFTFIDGLAAPFLKQADIEIPGLGIILTLVFIFYLVFSLQMFLVKHCLIGES